MSTFIKTRRNFLKRVGLGTTFVLPGILSTAKRSAARLSKSQSLLPVKPQMRQFCEVDVLVVGGGPAGLAARKGCLPRDLNVAELQDALRKDGVDLNYSGG